MIAPRRPAPLALLLIGLVGLCLIVVLTVRAQSQEVTPTAGATGESPPAKPTNLQASAEHDAVAFTWTASTDQTVTHYAILRRNRDTDATGVFHVIESNAGPETSYTDSSVAVSSRYNYRVKAVSPTGVSQWSGYVKANTPAAPDPTPTATPTPSPEDLAPTNLTAALADGGGVALSWSVPAEDVDSVTGYEVLRAAGEAEFTFSTLVSDTQSTATTYADATATQKGETYAYQVKAIRSADRSQASGQAEVQVPHDPEDLRPTGLTVSLVENKVTLSWTAPQEDAESVDGYEILRRRPMEGESALATLVADTELTATTYTDATANEAGVVYVYRVKALRGSEVSLWSNFAKIELPSDYVPDPTPEPESASDDLAPTGLTAALAEGGGVTLSWTAPAEDADSVTGYEIQRAVGEGEMATLAADTASTTTAYTDATATEAGETYAYRVKAIRGSDLSQASGQAQVQLPHDPVDLAPTGLTAFALIADSATRVGLTWTAPAEDAVSVTGYEILRAVGGAELTALVADTGNTAAFYTDATATAAGEIYAYQVKAIRDDVRSQASAEASVALPAATVSTCEFDAGGSDLSADTSTACALDVGGSVRGERGAADDVDWYRVGLQARATYQFDMRGKSTGEWQLVDGAPAFVSVGTLEDPKLLGIYNASGALVPGTDSELAGTGKDSRIASFSPDADGVYYISASAESGWTGTYELSLAVTAGDHVEGLTLLAPGGLEVSMVRNRLTLSWTAPAADAESVTGYEILRAVGEGELTTLVTDTASTSTSYRDDSATQAGVTYTYAVKALRGDDASAESNRASHSLPSDYTASTKELASKVWEQFLVYSETLEFAPQVVVQPDQDRQTIWTGDLILSLNSAYEATDSGTHGSLVPNTFIFNGTTHQVALVGLEDGLEYIPGTSDYARNVYLWIAPALDAGTYATWVFVTPGGEFNLADALVSTESRGNQAYQQFIWPETSWDPPVVSAMRVSLTGVGGTVGTEPEPDPGPPGIGLSWTTKRVKSFASFSSKPLKVGFTIHRSQRNLWGNFGSRGQQIGEVLNCDIDESGGVESCLSVPNVRGLRQSWTWTDETAERGVSYLYTIKPYHDFYSSDGTTVWRGILEDVIAGNESAPAHRVRIYGRHSNVSHRMPHPDAAGTPPNLTASQPNSGTCTGSCVRLNWDAAPNATRYVVFRTGQRTRETWVDYGLTYPQPADPDLTVTEWEDTSAEAGVNYGYRVAAFNTDGLRSATDAVVGFETPGGTTVPNRVRDLSAAATLKIRVKNTGQTVGGDHSLNTSTRERFAQRFKTGPNTGKVRVRSIAVKFGEIQDVSTAADELEATVNAVSGSDPGSVVCTLTDPATYVSEEVNRYHASSCDLDANTAYFFLLKRTGGTKTIELDYTTSQSEDPGSTAGWAIANSRYQYDSSGTGSWSSTANQVHLIEVIHAPAEAAVTLSWTAPDNLSSVTGAQYEVQYRLDIPEKAEWDDDWKTLSSSVAASATSYTHMVALEKYYARGGTTPPVEYVPTADKSTLRLHDSDTANDLILPFGINYEYRVRGVKGANKGLPADASVRIPNQDGLPSVVIIIEYVELSDCAVWEHVTDAEGNEPDGYRVLFASATRPFHQAKVARDYLPYATKVPTTQGVPYCDAGYSTQEWQGYPVAQRIPPGTEVNYWIAVQAYNDDGIGKGDGTGGFRSHGSAEIMKWVNKISDEHTAPVKGSEGESVGSGDDPE